MTERSRATREVRVSNSASGASTSVASTIGDITFWGLLALGVVLRILVLFSVGHLEDSDHAVVYLISKHVSEGQIDWFFWEQAYGGTLLEIVAGGAMVIFGAHVEVLSIVSLLIFAVVAWLLRQITSAALGRTTGNLAGILFWFSGFVLLRETITDPGFYSTSLCLGLLAIWLALRGDPRKSIPIWALLGFICGLALWQSPMGAALVAPAFVVAATRGRQLLGIVVGAAAGVVGALPWLLQLVGSFSALKPQTGQSGFQAQSLLLYFTGVLPAIFPFAGTKPAVVIATVAIALLALLAVLAVLNRSVWLGTLLVSSVLCVIVIVVGANAVLTASSFRYAIFIIPALAVPLAWLFTRVRFMGIAAMVLAAALTIGNTLYYTSNLTLGTEHRFGVGYQDLGAFLESKGVTAAYGDYWLAYRLTVVTNEQVTVASLVAHRYAPYEKAAAAEHPMAIVVFTGDSTDMFFSSDTKLPPASRTVLGDFTVYLYDTTFDPYNPPTP